MRQTEEQYEENRKKLARHCYNCQKIFWIKPDVLQRGLGKYCSKECMWAFGNVEKGPDCGRGECRRGKPAHPNSKKALLEFSHKPKSEEHKRKIAESNMKYRGSQKANWKGGITDIIKARRNRNDYRLWKLEVIKRSGHKCAECGSTKMLCAHHVHSFTDFPEIGFYPENGICLCKPCHWQWHWGDRNRVHPTLVRIKTLREFGEPFDGSHGNTEPSPSNREGVETMHGAPILGEDIVQTTNAEAAAKAVVSMGVARSSYTWAGHN